MYTTERVMHDLEAAGSEQTRKTYRRHGVGENQFGVSYATLGTMEKQIKREKDPNRDHDLGLELWATGNHDARVLALRLSDPTRMDKGTLNQWVQDVDNYGMADALGAFAARSAYANEIGYAWIDADHEWVESTGWNVLHHLILSGELTDAECKALLLRIERDIHTAKNRVRHEMNTAIINIGVCGGDLYTGAVDTAHTIGPVIVDHGQTGCKTPDAVAYIDKTRAYQAEKAARKAEK
ncbi:MAG: DNA alkylation repair protein [Anaerolineae bacterium]